MKDFDFLTMQILIKPGFTVLLFLHVFMVSAQTGGEKIKRPLNIVLFIADDLGVNDIEPYGNSIVRTPNLKKLAEKSVLFTKAFASSPTCTPSRSTIFTGLMPVRHGAHGNHSGVKAGTKSIVQYLQPLGYRVAIAGKYHIGPEDIFSFERVSKTNIPEPGFEKKPGLNYDLASEPIDEWLSQQQTDKPFMLVVADHSPHVIWPEMATYDPGSIDVPVNHIDTRETRISRARYYTDVSKMDANMGRLLNSLNKNKLAENTVVIFIADQGPQWPFAKWSLYDDGVRVPLIISWPGRNNEPKRTNALVSLADILPTIAEIAGGKAPDGIDGESFLDLLNGKLTEGRRFVYATHTGDKQINRSPARMVRSSQYKYILNLAPEIKYTTHMDLAKDHDGGREYWSSWVNKSFTDQHAASILWRYHNRPKEEFYDLIADPHELKNLAAESKYSSLLEQYRAEMVRWRKLQNDTMTGPEIVSDGPAVPGARPIAPYVFRD
ncbi:MAG: arylsulfatase A family protein [Chitinophagaceae bacterium]|nr:MAG: arylsulfatase A family protein [Chitinophagaceae bacterium]